MCAGELLKQVVGGGFSNQWVANASNTSGAYPIGEGEGRPEAGPITWPASIQSIGLRQY